MAAVSKGRRVARTLAWMAVALAATSPAVAKKANRATTPSSFDAAALIPIPKFNAAPSVTPRRERTEPATYFTIADALAKADGKPVGQVRLAAADPKQALEGLGAATGKRGDEPFGMAAFRAPEGQLWTRWRRLTSELAADEVTLSGCSGENCDLTARKFFDLLEQLGALTGRARLERVNLAVNRAITYASDMTTHGELDRWSAPLATLGLGRGDCEDYAILKRQVLIHAGVKPADLRIVLLRDTAVRLDHAVLAAKADDRWYILDNRKGGFFEEHDLPHYRPLFALDQTGVKLFAVPLAGLTPQVDGSAVMPGLEGDPWSDVQGAGNASASTLPPLL